MSPDIANRLVVVGLMLVVVSIAAVGQLALKGGLAQALGGQAIGGAADFARILTHPVVLLGITCYVVNLGLYFVVLSRARLGFAYPLVAMNYVAVTLLAWRFLNEPISRQQLLGLAIIILGVIVFVTQPGSSASQPTPPSPASTGAR